MAEKAKSLEELRLIVRQFAEARDWDQFHSPKNLSMALTAEAGELLEIFQWLSEAESRNPSAEVREAVRLEMADILIYLVRMADKLQIDLLESATRKVAINDLKYPIDDVRGSATKR